MASLDQSLIARVRSSDLLPRETTCAFVSGSLVEAWGNPRSDLDVFVISEPTVPVADLVEVRVPLDPGTIGLVATVVDGRRWDVEYWLDTQVMQILAKLEPAKVKSTNNTDFVLSPEEGDFLYRLGIGQPVVGAPWLQSRQAELQRSEFATVVVNRAMNRAESFVEDAVGQLEVHDVESAVLSAQVAFASCVEALLANAGDYAPSPKWRARQVRRSPSKALAFEEYWRIQTMQGFDPDRPAEWVRTTLHRIEELLMEIEL